MNARKRYHHARLTFKAWDTVVRELAERAEDVSCDQQGWPTAEADTKRARLRSLIEGLREVWTEEREDE